MTRWHKQNITLTTTRLNFIIKTDLRQKLSAEPMMRGCFRPAGASFNPQTFEKNDQKAMTKSRTEKIKQTSTKK